MAVEQDSYNHAFIGIADEQSNNNIKDAMNTSTPIEHFNPRLSAVAFNKLLEEIEIISEDEVAMSSVVSDQDLLLAATFIKDAIYGRNVPHKTDPNSIRSYNIYNSLMCRSVLYSAIIIILALALFERPAVDGLSTPYWIVMTIESICLLIFILRFLHNIHFVPGDVFWKDKKNIVIAVTIALTWLDMIVYVIVSSLDVKYALRWTRVLRPMFIINFSDGRQIRRAFRNIRRTLVDITNVLILFAFCIFLFALLAFKIFHGRDLTYPDGTPYFSSYLDCMWDLYVLVTTANNPDVMMPAYDANSWFSVFFVLYILFTNYIFMSILLAVIYNNYRRHLKNEVKCYVFAKRQILGRAFDVIKVKINDRYVVTKETWHSLMKVVSPERSSVQVDLLLFVLDEKSDGFIGRSEFLKVADLLSVKLTEVKDRLTLFEKYLPACYLSYSSELIKSAVRNKFFRYFFDLCIIVNAICIGLTINDAEWFFLVLFVMEILLKMYALGFRAFFHSYWNLFDTIIIGAALIATSIQSARHEYAHERNTLDILLVLRVLRLLKLIGSVKRFKVIITTIMNIGPSIVSYGGVIFVFYYIYAIVGMELFNGLIMYDGYGNGSVPYCGNPALAGSTFYHNRYCSNNFNDILKSCVLLFELMYVNQWNVLSQGFVLVTSKWAKLYFISFHMICVLLVLNIFVAFVLEAFILEYNLSAGKFESAVETKIKEMGLNSAPKRDKRVPVKDDKKELTDHERTPKTVQMGSEERESLPEFVKSSDLRFHLKKRSRKSVLVLLQSMFENELNPDDVGPENYDEFQVEDASLGNSTFYKF